MINIVGIFMISNICTKLQANYLKDNCHHHHHHHSEFDDEEEEEDHEEEEEEDDGFLHLLVVAHCAKDAKPFQPSTLLIAK